MLMIITAHQYNYPPFTDIMWWNVRNKCLFLALRIRNYPYRIAVHQSTGYSIIHFCFRNTSTTDPASMYMCCLSVSPILCLWSMLPISNIWYGYIYILFRKFTHQCAFQTANQHLTPSSNWCFHQNLFDNGVVQHRNSKGICARERPLLLRWIKLDEIVYKFPYLNVDYCYQHTEVETKWQTFRRRHFQSHFRE